MSEHPPEAFVIPADLLALTIRLVGQVPSQQGAMVYVGLTSLQPVENGAKRAARKRKEPADA